MKRFTICKWRLNSNSRNCIKFKHTSTFSFFFRFQAIYHFKNLALRGNWSLRCNVLCQIWTMSTNLSPPLKIMHFCLTVFELTGLVLGLLSFLRSWKMCLSKSFVCSSAAAAEQASSILSATWKHYKTQNCHKIYDLKTLSLFYYYHTNKK